MSERKLTVYALSIGVINIPSGKTMYDWDIYSNGNPGDSELFLCNDFFLYGAAGSLEVGDKVTIRNSDTQRKIYSATVTAILPNTKDELIKGLLEFGFDYRPVRAFKGKAMKRKLRTSYSIKGITDEFIAK